MDQLFCMRAFTRVVEHGSFAKAATSLQISPATLTAAIAQLETHLGVRLLERTTRRLNLNEEGQRYYNDCLRILQDITETEEALLTHKTTPQGRLRVSVPQSFTTLPFFFPHLSTFMAQYPQLHLEIIFTDRAVDLIEEGIDCAVRGSTISPNSLLTAKLVSRAKLITCASPQYLAEHGTPQSVDDLQQYNCIQFISPSTGKVHNWLFNHAQQNIFFTPVGHLSVTSYEAAVAAATHHLGITQAPEAIVFPALSENKLMPLLLDCVAEAPPLAVVYPANRYVTAKVRAFIEFMTQHYPKDGWWPDIVNTTPTHNAKG